MVRHATPVIAREETSATTQRCSCRTAFPTSSLSCVFNVLALGLLILGAPSLPAKGQEIITCPEPNQDLVMPPELSRSSDGILRGTINLIDEFRRVPPSLAGKPCFGVNVRVFQGQNYEGKDLDPVPPAGEPVPGHADAIPGPTLRARVGDLVQLKFVNTINPNNFDQGKDLDKEACLQVGPSGNTNVYPEPFWDGYPNCLHASSTANIHFHGTHTNPNSTGDNVYLQIRPLPRELGNLTTTPKEVTAGFDEFFKKCTEELRNPVNAWPVTWGDIPPSTKKSWTDKQTELLIAYQEKNPTQPLWDKNKEVLKESWPIYYIGAFPYCFALPAYMVDGPPPVMGQAPGTHWYHAHKHGSTAINVANGMTGAFIIEGQYDDDLDAAYREYVLKDGPWKARSQKVLVLNQLMDERHPHAMRAVEFRPLPIPGGVDFSVNGRMRPKVKMQPGEIQLWRIVNTSGRSAIYFMPPQGLQWQQIAQDGVQYAPERYIDGANLNQPFYMAPANRVDLLVRAPKESEGPLQVRVQNVMARSMVQKDPALEQGTVLLTVELTGHPVTMRNGQPPDEGMPFLTKDTAPKLPKFLEDITDDELRRSSSITRTLVFKSKVPNKPHQHTINSMQFGDGQAHLSILLGTTEEWTVFNETIMDPNAIEGPHNSAIDHPLHIHINPFQVTEFFDPNEKIMVTRDGKLVPVDRYFLKGVPGQDRVHDDQCELDPNDRTTWREGGKLQKHPCYKKSNLGWWDVFAIPAGRWGREKEDGTREIIPGYYKMRSRFVDYPGLYVMHCHILIHEDRGMMFSVEVLRTKPAPVRHH